MPINREAQVLINVVLGDQNIATSLITKVTQGHPGGLAAVFGQGCLFLGEFIHLFFGTHSEKAETNQELMKSFGR